MKIPKEVDFTVTVCLTEYGSIYVLNGDLKLPDGWVDLETYDFTVKIPPITAQEIILKKVELLGQSKEKLDQEHFQKHKFIDEQIQSLLAIENKSDESDTKIHEIDIDSLPV